MNELVSIIVPCHNQAQYLDEALQSVLDQTYTHWECMVVNDGSPDHTEEVAHKWTEKDSRFKYLYQENAGVSGARNFGIAHATGEFILPLDADDKISVNYIEECLKNTDNKNIKVVYGKAQFFGEQEGALSLRKATIENLLQYNCIHCSGLYRKTAWSLNNGYDENMKHGFEDWEFWINMLKRGGEAVALEQCILYYRIKPLSRSTEINSNLKKNDVMINYIFQKHIDLYGYTSVYDLYKEKLKLENKIRNFQFHCTYKQIIELFLKKFKLFFKKLIRLKAINLK